DSPYLLKYKLLHFLANSWSIKDDLQKEKMTGTKVGNQRPHKKQSLLDFLQEKIERSQSLFLLVIENLSVKKATVLNGILEKETISTRSEERFLIEFLNDLPTEIITVLYFLTQLPEGEL